MRKISPGVKGTIKELSVCSDLLRQGFQVFKNITAHGLDLVAIKRSMMLKVSVKSTLQNQRRNIRGHHVLGIVLSSGQILYRVNSRKVQQMFEVSKVIDLHNG